MKKTDFNRRSFLKLSALGAGAFALNNTTAGNLTPPDRKIIYRTLGKTGIKVPIVSMGVMRSDNPNIVKASRKLGITHFDTAWVYQNGQNETMLGETLKTEKREDLILATKIHTKRSGEGYDNFIKALDESLERLQTDYVDILYVHAVDNREEVLHEEHMRALRDLKEKGKIRFTGVSTHSGITDVFEAVLESDFYDVILTSYNFKMAGDTKLMSLIDQAAAKGIGIVAMKTMAGRFMDEEKTKPVNCKAALKWALSNPNIHTSIPGYTTFDQLLENFSVMEEPELNQEELKDLELAGDLTGMFCLGCKDCVGQCKNNVPVSDIMRAYMYNYGYSYPAKAQQTMISSGHIKGVCESCEECVVQCSAGFDVAHKINQMEKIMDVPSEFLV